MIGVQWTGWDGSEWDLRNGPGIYLTDAGVSGLLELEAEIFTRTSSLIDGQEVTGWKANPREIVLPIDISSEVSAEDWYSRQTAFNRTLRPDRNGTLTITDPIGAQRTIQAHLDGSVGGSLPVDPTLDMGLTTVVNLIADDPWYKGPAVVQPFLDASNVPRQFYGGEAVKKAGPPFYLGTGIVTGDTTIENVGDYDFWPIWILHGPFDGLFIDVTGQQIISARTVDADQRLEIDTRQGEKVAWLYDETDGTRINATDYLTTADFARVVDGAQVPVTIRLTGTGTAAVAFQPRYFRAVG